MKIIVDESVSYAVVEELKANGYSVIAIADSSTSGLSDEEIYNML